MAGRLYRMLNIPVKTAGVEIIILPDGKLQVHYVILNVKGRILSRETGGSVSSIDALAERIDPHIPLSVTLNGKGILHKKVSATADKSLSALIPNAKPGDFYVQEHSCPAHVFISLIRKDTADPILTALRAHGYLVSALHFGPFGADKLNQALHLFGEKGVFAGHVFNYQENILQDHSRQEPVPADLNIAGENLEDIFLIAYASAFNNLTAPEKPISDSIRKDREEVHYKSLFRFSAAAVLVFFFLLLLVNFFLFNRFSNENQHLSLSQRNSQAEVAQLQQVQEEIDRKEAFLTHAGWMEPSRVSYLADRVASTVPASVQLSAIRINPVDEKASRTARDYLFKNDTLLVSGSCRRPTDLNTWIDRIEQFDWYRSVTIETYAFNTKSGLGEFTLIIHTR